MNSATLRTMRETVGLTAQQAADLAGVSLRTWQYWESPDGPDAKDDIGKVLASLLSRVISSVDAALDMLDSLPPEGNLRPVTLTRYRTQSDLNDAHPNFHGGLSAHNALIGHMLVVMTGEGFTPTVVWDDDLEAAIRPGL